MTWIQREVLVFGAGPAGSSVALALRQGGLDSVEVLTRPASDSDFLLGESASPNVPFLLEKLRLEKDLRTLAHPTLGNCSLWGSPIPQFEDNQLKGHGPAWHLDRLAFNEWLFDSVRQRGVVTNRIESILSVQPLEKGWSLWVKTPEGTEQEYRASFLVDATGRSAALARHLGAKVERLDEQVCRAMLFSPRLDTPLVNYALVEAEEEGWWYAACLPYRGEIRAILCFFTDQQQALEGKLHERQAFLERFSRSKLIRPWLEDLPNEGVRSARAQTQVTDQVHGPGWVALGDAALGMDPLTSSGINCAMSDGLNAAQAIMEELAGGQGAIARFGQSLHEAKERYLAERRQYYQLEGRWRDSPFWAHRHQAPQAGRIQPLVVEGESA